MQETARGFYLFEGAPLVWEVQDPNVECYLKVAAAVQNAAQYHHVTYDKKKQSFCIDITGSFFSRGWIELNPARNQTCAINVRHEWDCSLPSVSCCWQSFTSTIGQPLPAPVSNTSCLFSRCQPVCQLLYCIPLYFSRYCTVRLENVFFIFVIFNVFLWKVL